MASIHEKAPDRSRTLLLEFLVYCCFPNCPKKDCPIWEQRNCLSTEKKRQYAMGLSDKEIKKVLLQHEHCYEKRLSDLNKW